MHLLRTVLPCPLALSMWGQQPGPGPRPASWAPCSPFPLPLPRPFFPTRHNRSRSQQWSGAWAQGARRVLCSSLTGQNRGPRSLLKGPDENQLLGSFSFSTFRSLGCASCQPGWLWVTDSWSVALFTATSTGLSPSSALNHCGSSSCRISAAFSVFKDS